MRSLRPLFARLSGLRTFALPALPSCCDALVRSVRAHCADRRSAYVLGDRYLPSAHPASARWVILRLQPRLADAPRAAGVRLAPGRCADRRSANLFLLRFALFALRASGHLGTFSRPLPALAVPLRTAVLRCPLLRVRAFLTILCSLLASVAPTGSIPLRIAIRLVGVCRVLIGLGRAGLLPLLARIREIRPGILDFPVDLLCQRIELIARLPQGFGFISKNAFRRTLDPFFQIFDFVARLLLNLLRLRRKPSLGEQLRIFEFLIRIRLGRFSERVVEFLREQRLDRFRLFADPPHFIADAGKLRSLLFKLLRDFLPLLVATAQSRPFRLRCSPP